MRARGCAKLVLPQPVVQGSLSLEAALTARRSVRSFTPEPLTAGQLGQILWAAQGITEPVEGLRTVPSAGALYPLECYVITGDGIWRYQPSGHALYRIQTGDYRARLATACLAQDSVADAPASLVICGVVERTRRKYGRRAERYVHLEAGHAAQNVLLQAVAIGLGGVPVGAFDDAAVQAVLDLPATCYPYYVIPLGNRR